MLRPPVAKDGAPQVDGGVKQDEAAWPATLKYYAATGGGFLCTATLIGSRTVITAAHCIPRDALAEIEFAPGKTIGLVCKSHPDYEHATLTFDLALCLTDRVVRPSPAFGFERLDDDFTHIKANAKLFLLGYGCRDVNNPGNPDKVGQLYGGVATISNLPSEQGGHIVTGGPDDVVICPGDSGGAAYRVNFGSDGPLPEGSRAIVGVNSGFIADGRVSAIAAFTPSLTEFVERWASENGASICGVHPAATNCR